MGKYDTPFSMSGPQFWPLSIHGHFASSLLVPSRLYVVTGWGTGCLGEKSQLVQDSRVQRARPESWQDHDLVKARERGKTRLQKENPRSRKSLLQILARQLRNRGNAKLGNSKETYLGYKLRKDVQSTENGMERYSPNTDTSGGWGLGPALGGNGPRTLLPYRQWFIYLFQREIHPNLPLLRGKKN